MQRQHNRNNIARCRCLFFSVKLTFPFSPRQNSIRLKFHLTPVKNSYWMFVDVTPCICRGVIFHLLQVAMYSSACVPTVPPFHYWMAEPLPGILTFTEIVSISASFPATKRAIVKKIQDFPTIDISNGIRPTRIVERGYF